MGLLSAFHQRVLGALHLVGWGGERWLWGQSCDRHPLLEAADSCLVLQEAWSPEALLVWSETSS